MNEFIEGINTCTCEITVDGMYKCTPCLVCGEGTLATSWQSFKICEKCKTAILYIRKKIEKGEVVNE